MVEVARRRRGRPCKVMRDFRQGKLDFLTWESLSEEAKDSIRGLIQSRPISHTWRGLLATPPGSVIYKVVQVFDQYTDFPLELPFFQTLHFLSGYLLSRDVMISFSGKTICPDVWTVLLSESGSGKTETKNFLELATNGDVRIMPESTSAAKFIQDLAEYNKSLFILDEFAQMIKKMETQSYAEELKDYFLKLYDGKRISRRTTKAEIVVEKPALTILGMNVPETFLKSVTAESMVDGFAQRFSYVVARRDPDKNPRDYALYRLFEHIDEVVEPWKQITEMKIHQTYHVSKTAEAAYVDAYRLLFPPKSTVPLSFFRRIMWRSVKYALLYHITLGKESDLIDDADIQWAAALSMMHIEDAKVLLDNYGLSDFERTIRKAEALRDKFTAVGKKVGCRELIQGVAEIKSKVEAMAVMSFL